MEVSQNIPIYSYSVTLAYNGISIIVFFKAPDLKCIFYDTWSSDIFLGTSSTCICVSVSPTFATKNKYILRPARLPKPKFKQICHIIMDFYHVLCLNGKSWSCGHPVGG